MTSIRLSAGDTVATRELQSVNGNRVCVPDDERRTHLQLRRFAGCPACNLHLRGIARRYTEIQQAGVVEVVVFRSASSALEESAEGLPFELIADPEGDLYHEFGVGRGWAAVGNPRAWPALLRGARVGLAGTLLPGEDLLTLPADFLIDRRGRVLRCHYGRHANDQWSADDVLEFASRPTPESCQIVSQPIHPSND